MQPKDFLYFLTDELGRSYSIENGVVTLSSTPVPLSISPDGWQDKTIKYSRNVKAGTLWRSYTNPMKYVKQAAHIVRDRLYRFGTEDKIYLVIHRLDKSFSGGWVYRFFYKGELDLTQIEDSDTNISVNIMEGDLVKLLKANENTQYEIDINVPEAVVVKLDGVYLHEKHNWIVQTDSRGGDVLVGMIFTTKEGEASGVATFTVYSKIEPGDLTTSSDYFLTTTQIIDGMRLWGSVNVTVLAIDTGTVNVRLKSNLGRNDVIASMPYTAGNPIEIPFDYSFTSNIGENFFLVVDTPNLAFVEIEESNITLEYRSRYPTTYVKGLRPAYVAQQLLDKITGGGYTFSSTYLTTVWENLLVTSGDAIRGFENAKLKISWSEFFEGYDVPCSLCYGIRNQALYIEEKAKGFQSTILQAMGEVKDLVVSAAKDFQFNTVKVGYPNTDTEDVNGRDEFNVTQAYTSPVKKVSKVFELVSKIRASMYEIELTRIKTAGKDTTDDDNDTRSFFLHVEKTATEGAGDEPGSYYKLLRNTYDSVAGILDPDSAFNIELHPELCLKRHGSYLRGVFYWLNGNLDYQTSDKNGNLAVVKGGQTYIGQKNIPIPGLGSPLFYPLQFKFESPMSNDIVETMDAGPDGTFSFQYDGNTYYGFPMEVSFQPANRPAQETVLLCSPQTDLTKLITLSR
jgi:hypothetical protein